jgi:hypothetical protein
MKKQTVNNVLLFVLLTTFSGCQIIGDIFKTGVGVGIFIVVIIIVIVGAIVSRSGKGSEK